MSDRADRFDRADYDLDPAASQAEVVQSIAAAIPASEQPIWPIAGLTASDVGDSLMDDRRGRPHKGIDLHAPAGTPVVLSRSGEVIRVVDGRGSDNPKKRRAGLFVDVRGNDSLIYRYIHLGDLAIGQEAVGTVLPQGTTIGFVAKPYTSGSGKRPHLHFEIRRADYRRSVDDYGSPINPLHVLKRPSNG